MTEFKYQTVELVFHGDVPEGSEIKTYFTAVFSHNGKEESVKGFYAGNNTYSVRYYPTEAGEYSWKVNGISGVMEDTEGCFVCEESNQNVSSNEKSRGRVQTSGYQFCYEDGTTYIPVGTTAYALVHQKQALLEETLHTLTSAPFNKIRFCIFPKHYNFNKNDPDHFAFVKTEDGFDFTKPDYTYWERLDGVISRLNDLHIEADLILFHPYDRWGFSKMSEEVCMNYLSYLIRRLSAFPNVWWSLANEYDLMHAFEPERWDRIATFIGENDPYHHLLSNHDWVTPWKFEHPAVTHCCLQDSDARRIPIYQKKYGKPVIFDEMGYEGNIPFEWGNLSGFELVNRFWKAFSYGGYASHGETFINGMSDDQVLWWAKGGTLKGESPKRIAFLKDLFESFPGALQLYTPVSDTSFATKDELQELIENKADGIYDNDVMLALVKLDDMEFQRILSIIQPPIVHFADDVFLTYFGSMCTSIGNLSLPESSSYKVEVIDVWEMTRTVVMENVKGNIEVALPGKEGIALLATKMEPHNR